MGTARKTSSIILRAVGAESGAGARVPRPVGAPAAFFEREASWSAERQFRHGPATGVIAEFDEFCLTRGRQHLATRLLLVPLGGLGYLERTGLYESPQRAKRGAAVTRTMQEES